MVILSKNHIFAPSCLEQLCFVLNCVKTEWWRVLPVYYDVERTDLERLTGPFADAFTRHEKRFKDKVIKWKNALTQLSNLNLWYTLDEDLKHKCIDGLVNSIYRFVRPTYGRYLVGLESPKKEVSSLLELESKSDEVVIVGMYGISGIGKTTLAKALLDDYEFQFEDTFYLDNLTDVDIGDYLIKNRFELHSEKVLLILDGVDKLEQLEALVGKPDLLGPGSRVIITTRDKNLLTFHGIERAYEVQHLNPEDSRKLLEYQIFKQGNFDPSYAEILNELASYASGLPSALEVIGTYLSGKSVEQCESALRQFKRIPLEEIQIILKRSIDALEGDEKNTFLDIACCFQGYKFKLANAQNILCAHRGDDVKFHIEALKEKSLIGISSDGTVTLHPLIEAMGKEIVRQEGLKEPGKRSRLWFHTDIVEVLKNNSGTEKIEIIHMGSPLIEDGEAIEWSGEAFKKMKNLRTLINRTCDFSKAPNYLLDSLRVLEWWRYPSENLPHEFNPNQLVICKLPMKGIKSPKLVELTETLPNASEVLQSSHSVPEVYQTLQNVSEVVQILKRVYENDWTWRVGCLVSSTSGLVCCARSRPLELLMSGMI